jgi:hypothetical protein
LFNFLERIYRGFEEFEKKAVEHEISVIIEANEFSEE